MAIVSTIVGHAVPNENGRLPLSRCFHVRVLLPCYKESLELFQATVNACLNAELPTGCRRTVYICDDGKDPGACLLKPYATRGERGRNSVPHVQPKKAKNVQHEKARQHHSFPSRKPDPGSDMNGSSPVGDEKNAKDDHAGRQWDGMD